MPVVDIHVHIYPEKIAKRAAESVGQFYLAPMFGDGSIDCMLNEAAQSPITHQVVHSVATKPAHVTSINDFIAQSCKKNNNFIGFATMHQGFEDVEKELDRVLSMGLVGIKIHPDTQKVNMDDPRLMRLYQAMEKRSMPLIVHTGDYRYDYSHPRRLKHILHEFPNLVANAAHFGGWSVYDMALEYLEDEKCYLDCSSAMAFLGKRRTRELCEIYGTDRILFGSDYPMWSPTSEYRIFRSLGFSEKDFEVMTWHNAERFLQRTIS